LNTYGTSSNPFPELPPAASFYSVNWGGVEAVKWGPASALRSEAALAVPDSATGTMSMWVKFHDDLFYEIMSFQDRGMSGFNPSTASLEINAGGYTDYLPTPGPIQTSLRLSLQAQHDATDPPRPGMFYLDDLRISDFEKWYHIYMEWNTDAGTSVLKINGVTVPVYEYPGDVYLDESHTGPPFTTHWSESVVNSLAMFYNHVGDGPGFSIADYWMDVDRVGVGVEKFVDLETGRPRMLGAFGEKPITPAAPEGEPDPPPVKPAFFFHRQGSDALTFLENRGTGGVFYLTGDDPTPEPDRPKFAASTSGMR